MPTRNNEIDSLATSTIDKVVFRFKSRQIVDSLGTSQKDCSHASVARDFCVRNGSQS